MSCLQLGPLENFPTLTASNQGKPKVFSSLHYKIFPVLCLLLHLSQNPSDGGWLPCYSKLCTNNLHLFSPGWSLFPQTLTELIQVINDGAIDQGVTVKTVLGIYPEETKIEKDTCIGVFIAGLFTIARTWKHTRCPLTDKRIKKLWYIYMMEYYSAIKRNAFEWVLMRWMNLEPIIQNEVSQKEETK